MAGPWAKAAPAVQGTRAVSYFLHVRCRKSYRNRRAEAGRLGARLNCYDPALVAERFFSVGWLSRPFSLAGVATARSVGRPKVSASRPVGSEGMEARFVHNAVFQP